jgi:hypothetical protein
MPVPQNSETHFRVRSVLTDRGNLVRSNASIVDGWISLSNAGLSASNRGDAILTLASLMGDIVDLMQVVVHLIVGTPF